MRPIVIAQGTLFWALRKNTPAVHKPSLNHSGGQIKKLDCVEANMKPLGEIEENLANKAEPVLGFKPSSKFKRGPIGIIIYFVCGIIALISLRSAGVI